MGVILVEADDWKSQEGINFDVLALLLSAILWAGYEVSIAVLLPSASTREINIFIGYRGLWNLLLL